MILHLHCRACIFDHVYFDAAVALVIDVSVPMLRITLMSHSSSQPEQRAGKTMWKECEDSNTPSLPKALPQN